MTHRPPGSFSLCLQQSRGLSTVTQTLQTERLDREAGTILIGGTFSIRGSKLRPQRRGRGSERTRLHPDKRQRKSRRSFRFKKDSDEANEEDPPDKNASDDSRVAPRLSRIVRIARCSQRSSRPEGKEQRWMQISTCSILILTG